MLLNSSFRILITSLVLSIILTACAPGGGYNRNNQWEYGSREVKTAEDPPRPLGDIYRENAQSATDRTGVDVSAAPQAPQTPVTTNQNLPPVKVALLVPLSGKHQNLGQAMLNAAQIALFDIGHKNYQLIPKVSRVSADVARSAARRAIGE